ncbi:Bro-N domain-containing protein [Paucibacter sp. Y2R2-4]|uniref:BRO-N domain-containing protein n=1 Tax=Paucibacter sp. Y2R2-4 TaxID=2893553 RepID=UPI0021E419A1|nr:Bro-N domain-containing protein [Paucibacter sp. Y2R2-4]MCV2349335.1 Bro-N domain-containing protein [Paucibacter sp. Y2R2-4]
MATYSAGAAALVFQDTEFDIVDLHGSPWLRGTQIADALGYLNGRQRVQQVYQSNADEFTPDMTQVLELPTAGGIQPVRIFSLRGAHLLGMLSRTERAAAFRRWVLDVLEGREAPQQSGTMTYPQRLAFLKERRSLVRELGGATQRAAAEELYENLRQVSRLLGIQPRALRSLAPGMQQEPLPGVGGEGGAAGTAA